MDSPITEFYEDEGLINGKTMLLADEERPKLLELLKKKKIDTCLFLFIRDDENYFDFTKLSLIYEFKNASNKNKIYNYKNKFLIARTPLGGPAAVGLMEDLGFLGIKNFIAFGSAGKIDNNFNATNYVLVDKAIRDEGTSYHYQKPSIYAETDKELTKYIQNYLEKNEFRYEIHTTWTTDAFFRETQKVIDKRIKQGAVCVEMECASWCACAKYRNYKFAQLLYFSDTIKQGEHTWHLDRNEIKAQMIKHIINCVNDYVKDKKG